MGIPATTADYLPKIVDLTPQQEHDVTPSATRFTDDFVFLKIGASFKKIQLQDIDYIVYADRYPNMVIADKQFPLNVTMKDLAKSLSHRQFIQIHQSFIANINKINQINLADNQVETVGKCLPIGISFKKAILNRLTFLT